MIKLDKYIFAGNFPDLPIESSTPVQFELIKAGEILLSELYVPIDGVVSVKLKSFFEQFRAPVLPEDNSRLVSSEILPALYTYKVNGVESEPFCVLAGGVGSSDTLSFVKGNFLTWQPQTRHTTYHAPQWLRYMSLQSGKLKIKAYFEDGTQSTIDGCTLVEGKIYTFSLQYGAVMGLFGKTPQYYDVWVEYSGGKSYVQRYVYAHRNEINDDWFVFENSLGGFDTILFRGESKEIGDYKSATIVADDIESDYDTSLRRQWKKSTGYIPDERTRVWALEFFQSRSRFIVGDSKLESICVSEPKIESIRGEYAGYEFTYFKSYNDRYLNLTRDTLPENIEIVSPAGELFFLAPRLNEFPSAEGDDILFPVQYVAGETWSKISLRDIEQRIFSSLSSVGGSGSLKPHAATHRKGGSDELTPSDIGAASAEELRNHNHDKQYHPLGGRDDLNIEADEITGRSLDVGGFLAGVRGAGIDKYGNGEMESLNVRSYIRVEELLFNRLQAMEGDFVFTEAGTIESVSEIADRTYILTIRKRWEHDFTAIDVDDVIKGIVNNLYQPGGEFYTSWMRVINKDAAANTLTVVLYDDIQTPSQRNFAPCSGMNIARRGNVTDARRQSSWQLSSADGRIEFVDGVDSPTLIDENFAMMLGKLRRLEIFENLPINYDQPYGYFRGLIVQDLMRVDYRGIPVKNITDRGLWSIDIAQSSEPYRCTVIEAHEVWHRSCKYRCLADKTVQEPRWNSPHWVLVSGDTELRMEVDSSAGLIFVDTMFSSEITATVYRGVSDITSDIQPQDWSWSRDSGDSAADTLWAIEHQNAQGSITITQDDIDYGKQVTITAKAYVRDNEEFITKTIPIW